MRDEEGLRDEGGGMRDEPERIKHINLIIVLIHPSSLILHPLDYPSSLLTILS
jgi:hypothetical protein